MVTRISIQFVLKRHRENRIIHSAEYNNVNFHISHMRFGHDNNLVLQDLDMNEYEHNSLLDVVCSGVCFVRATGITTF